MGGDEGVHAQGQLDEEGAEGVDAQIIRGVADGIGAGPEGQEEVIPPEEEYRRQRQGEEDLQGEAAAQDAFRLVVVPLAHGDGGPGGAAGGHQRREGGDDEDHRHADAEARQGQVAAHGHVADVDAVHDVIEHVHDLGRHCGDGQPSQQRADGLGAQKGLVLIHVSFSFSGRPWERAVRF